MQGQPVPGMRSRQIAISGAGGHLGHYLRRLAAAAIAELSTKDGEIVRGQRRTGGWDGCGAAGAHVAEHEGSAMPS